MSIDDVIREEVHAEAAIRQILIDLQDKLRRRVEWVKAGTPKVPALIQQEKALWRRRSWR